MITNINFNCVYIIQSYPENDPQSGNGLSILIDRLLYKFENIIQELIDVETKQDFINAMEYIYNRLLKEGIIPYIHLEMHGSRDGIHFKNDEMISWSDLRPMFSEINYKSKMQLFVSVATCYGGFMIKTPSPIERVPFLAYIGYVDEIGFPQAEGDWNEYFIALFNTMDFGEAVKALNNNNPNPQYLFYSANLIWEEYKKNWNKMYDTEEKKHAKVLAMVQIARDEGFNNPQIQMEVYFRSMIEKRHLHLDQLKGYFMHETDEFPKQLV